MKTFLIHLMTFGFIIVSFSLLGIWFINISVSAHTNFDVNRNLENVIFGNSHPECAFNDSLIDNFSNFARSGEAYFYTYLKAKNVIEENPEIQNVFIEFSSSGLVKRSDGWIWSDAILRERYNEYAPLLSFKEHLLLFTNNKKGFISNIPFSSKINLKKWLHQQNHFGNEIGGYHYLESRDARMNDDTSATSEFKDEDNPVVSDTNLLYLKKLVDLSKKSGKNVFFIRSPMRKNFKIKENQLLLKKLLNTQFETIEFLDFSDFPLEASEFYDNDHVNYLGARKFSMFFNSLLARGLLKKSNKQEWVQNKMTEYTNK